MIATTSRPIITVIGSLNVDLVVYTPRIPQAGETLKASSSQIGMGGKGANQAVACARLSRKQASSHTSMIATVNMIGAVGEDGYGNMILSGMEEYGVDISNVRVERDGKTGMAFITVEEATAENRILLSPEANDTMLPADFAQLPNPRPDLIILQLEIPLATVLQIMKTAKKHGIPVLLNPAPAHKVPIEYYNGLAHLVMNETEACFLAECAEYELNTTSGISNIAGKFRHYGVQNVLITLGSRGVYYSTSQDEEGFVAAEKVKVVDTTAAGDTFIGAYAVEVVKGDFSIAEAVQVANRAAALTVQKKGAQQSIPWLDEVV